MHFFNCMYYTLHNICIYISSFKNFPITSKFKYHLIIPTNQLTSHLNQGKKKQVKQI